MRKVDGLWRFLYTVVSKLPEPPPCIGKARFHIRITKEPIHTPSILDPEDYALAFNVFRTEEFPTPYRILTHTQGNVRFGKGKRRIRGGDILSVDPMDESAFHYNPMRFLLIDIRNQDYLIEDESLIAGYQDDNPIILYHVDFP